MLGDSLFYEISNNRNLLSPKGAADFEEKFSLSDAAVFKYGEEESRIYTKICKPKPQLKGAADFE